MKAYLKRILLFVICIACMQSCDDYLEVTNPNEISTDTFFRNLEESNRILTGVYGSMLNSWIVSAREEAWRSDMAFPGIREGNIAINALNYYQHVILEDNTFINDRWQALYQVIWRANELIDGLNSMDDSLKSQQEWTNQMGQARFFRGLAHFYLHSLYNEGKIVIRDAVPANQEEIQKTLSTSEEVIEFFREDLLFAYENLPPTFFDRTRVTAGTAATILGTSYLYSASQNPEDYQIAKRYFEDVINGPYGYKLVQDTSIMFVEAGDYNSESIFELNYTTELQLEDGSFDEESFATRNGRFSAPKDAGGASVNEQFTAAAWLIHAYSNEPLNTSDPRNTVTDRGTGLTRLRKVSLRASAMIAMVNDEDTEYYLSPSAPNKVNFSGKQRKYGFFKKYTNHDIAENEIEKGDTNFKSGKNVILNRLADVYLMYAECLLLGDNDIQGAIDNINPIRERWGLQLLDINADLVTGVPYTQQSLMDHLMFVERPLELSVEGVSIRAIDLRRWGIAKERYTDLSTQPYYVIDYEYYNDANAALETSADSFVQQGISPDPDNDPQLIQEYTGAAQFYTNGYLVLPTIETLNNPAVSGSN
ncbi:RagB/SusD family nutrient uptake outer membrane protein [Aquimarina algicola]|uniref:RagB/SusD family nutrient uptake outer membrane protein n=1 Tax=Aquimarina algicola TaxID=2589995 RepID=A0A504J6R6_9FLAO|nr:RagB/SusD family nutrient uptake outer membrane protein [Aquimarina algicola]TPN86224.1 RagB/SusD family nutrient uptake outer membrane protein [Aquimarina algicola]